MSNAIKKIVTLVILVYGTLLQAQDFKPYKVKSGKITYEKLKYSTHSGFSSINGVETSYSKQVPYVAEQVIYYWDEYGDIAFEETYKVSAFGGKLLPEKIKISECLWVNEHRYYFNVEKNKVSDDPFHLRIKCKENFQYYQIKDSWIETIYMGTEKTGTKEILEKEATYYRIDNYHDIYAWKGLVLKDESFFTSGSNGPRNKIDRAKVAVKIDTKTIIDKNIFNPKWLEKYLFYQKLDFNTIGGLLDTRQDLLRQAEENGLELKKGDIIIYVTSDTNLGKFQVLSTDNYSLIIKYVNYNSIGEVVSQSNNLTIKNTFSCDLDQGVTYKNKIYRQDFKWSSLPNFTLFPYCNLGFYLIKSSRVKFNKV